VTGSLSTRDVCSPHESVAVTLASRERRIYRVDPLNHQVVVSDADTRRVIFIFGGRGSTPGQFDVPIDIALVAPSFLGEPLGADPDPQWIAVADYGNARVQIFDLHGALIDVLTGDDLDYGWRPCRLTWRAPFLQIDGPERSGCRLHLAAAVVAHLGADEPRGGPLGSSPQAREELH
jgi:hypothetical protein